MWTKTLLVTFILSVVAECIHGSPHDPQGLSNSAKKHQAAIPMLNIREILKKYGHKLKFINQFTPEAEKDPIFWKNLAHENLMQQLKKNSLNMNQAKNVIFFLGDGMSPSTVVAARILKGQRKHKSGEGESLSFEKFPHTGISKTYCTNAQVPDSACTATAYSCGVKSNILTIGVKANVNINNCTESEDPENHVSSIAQWAQKAGKSTGLITTSRITDASPSGMYAHVPNRFFESDHDIREYIGDATGCTDIATQLITQEPGCHFDVIMGGGISKFLPNTTTDIFHNLGVREDGKDLLSTWKEKHPKGIIVSDRDELRKLDTSQVSHIMGIFQSNDMDYNLKANHAKQPTLSEMTKKALELLMRNDKGYFIFIEAGLIDVAHHETKARLALDETLEFDKAIKLARKMTNEKDTLIVVTADHSHSLNILGYPHRGADILDINKLFADSNGQKYMTLQYGVGPKQYLDEKGHRLNLEKIPKGDDFQYPSYLPSNKGQHSGDDVAIYASGPWDHLFSGVMEQSTIPHFIAYAACMGDGPTMCDEANKQTQNLYYRAKAFFYNIKSRFWINKK